MSILSDALKKADKHYSSKKTAGDSGSSTGSGAESHHHGFRWRKVLAFSLILLFGLLLAGASWWVYASFFQKKATQKPVKAIVKKVTPKVVVPQKKKVTAKPKKLDSPKPKKVVKEPKKVKPVVTRKNTIQVLTHKNKKQIQFLKLLPLPSEAKTEQA